MTWKHAVGEVFLIVVGITIALAVNDWYSERADRVSEAEYLARLQVDLGMDLESFPRYLAVIERKAAILQDLLIESVESLLARDPDTLITDLRYSGFISLPDSQSTTFNELMSTGNLALLQDLDQRDLVSRYYSGYEQIATIFDSPRGPYGEILFGSLSGNMWYRWRVDGETPNKSELRRGLEKLLSHPEIESAINGEIVYAVGLASTTRDYIGRAQELVELLSQEQ